MAAPAGFSTHEPCTGDAGRVIVAGEVLDRLGCLEHIPILILDNVLHRGAGPIEPADEGHEVKPHLLGLVREEADGPDALAPTADAYDHGLAAVEHERFAL